MAIVLLPPSCGVGVRVRVLATRRASGRKRLTETATPLNSHLVTVEVEEADGQDFPCASTGFGVENAEILGFRRDNGGFVVVGTNVGRKVGAELYVGTDVGTGSAL